jgi:hypothetical protein
MAMVESALEIALSKRRALKKFKNMQSSKGPLDMENQEV